MKRNTTDDLFSKYIRTRDKWTCVKCGTYYPEGHRQGLHCSHIYSRRHRALRWDERNAVAHCFHCHQWFGGNPIESGEWARKHLGDDIVDELIRIKNDGTIKVPKTDEPEIRKQIRAKLRALDE